MLADFLVHHESVFTVETRIVDFRSRIAFFSDRAALYPEFMFSLGLHMTRRDLQRALGDEKSPGRSARILTTWR